MVDFLFPRLEALNIPVGFHAGHDDIENPQTNE